MIRDTYVFGILSSLFNVVDLDVVSFFIKYFPILSFKNMELCRLYYLYFTIMQFFLQIKI